MGKKLIELYLSENSPMCCNQRMALTKCEAGLDLFRCENCGNEKVLKTTL